MPGPTFQDLAQDLDIEEAKALLCQWIDQVRARRGKAAIRTFEQLRGLGVYIRLTEPVANLDAVRPKNARY